MIKKELNIKQTKSKDEQQKKRASESTIAVDEKVWKWKESKVGEDVSEKLVLKWSFKTIEQQLEANI